MDETTQVKRKRMTQEEYCKILDDAETVKLYTEEGWTQEKISKEFGVSKGAVANYLKNIKGIKVRAAKKRPELREVYPAGTKFGQWTIISDEVKVGNDRALYQLCKCSCGNISWKKLVTLRNGTSTRCKKCCNKTFITEDGKISINAMIVTFYKHILDGVKRRKKVSQLDFNITPEYLEELYEKQNHKCALSGISLELDITKSAMNQNWSLDRIDSSKGYVKGNVQWVHKDINMMKQSYNVDYFIKLCTEVAKYNKYSKCE